MISPLIQQVRSLVKNSWRESEELVYVFPSEIAAGFWSRDLARYGDIGPVQVSRFISWDSFKEKVFRGEEVRKPANALVRSLFAESFLQKNSIAPESERLTRFIPGNYAKEYSGFVNPLVRMLPGLGILFKSRIIQAIESTMDPEILEDYRKIWLGYTDFLDVREYYEPSWLDDKSPSQEARGYVFFPELLEDWGEFQHAVQNMSGIHCVPLPDIQGNQNLTLSVFPNQAEELGMAMDWVEDRLRNGTRPGEIVITLGGYDDCLPALEREAWLRGIPLEGRRGAPLASFIAPSMFRRLQKGVVGGYSFESLEELFVSPAIPWKAGIRENVRNFLRLGIESDLSFTSAKIWTSAIAKSSRLGMVLPKDSMTSFLQQIDGLARKLMKAPTFRKLQEAVEVALRQLISHPDKWSPVEQGALQRSREVLNSLAQTEEDLGLPVSNPLEFWLGRLEESLYVPQGTKGVVEVYPYRVSAGIPAQVHLILNMNQRDVGVVTGGLSFLRDDQLELLGSQVFRNMTGDFLLGYSQSGLETYLSASEKTYGGARVPATWFLDHGKQVECLWPAEGTDLIRRTLGYRLGQEGQNFLRTQNGLVSDSSLGSWDQDYLAKRFHESKYRNGSIIKISNKQLQDYSQCGLAYMVSHGLRVREQNWKPVLQSPRTEGIVYHRILENFFRTLRDTDRGMWDSALWENEYVPKLRDLAENEIKLAYPGEFIPLVQTPLVNNILGLVREVLNRIPRGSLVSFEEGWNRLTDLVWQGLELTITGRIDGVFTEAAGGNTVIMDFKRSLHQSHKASEIKKQLEGQGRFLSGDDSADDESDGADDSDGGRAEGGLQLQLLVYSLLLAPVPGLGLGELVSQEKDFSVPSWTGNPDILGSMYYSAFISPDKKKPEKRLEMIYHRRDLGKNLAGLEDLKRAQGFIIGLLQDLKQSLEQGEFREPSGGCTTCRFRGICRTKFALNTQPGGST